MSNLSNTNRPLLLAILAAIGASACCIGPLLLLTLGISGAWIGNLTAMQPYSPYFTAATVIALFMVFRTLYLVPQSCDEGALCVNPNVLKNQRIIFWVVAIVLIAMVTFPYYAQYLID
ncbi:MAG: mercury transporter MerT [Algicola sp.]|nr:mercury transporter MerT [Algicola sp.]